MASSESANCKVWGVPIRIGHWALALSVAAAWFTRSGAGAVHEWTGYAALGLVALRVLYGCVGPRRARFADFLRAPTAILLYARSLWARREPRYLGHNPLGGLMIVALLGAVALAGLSGWLFTTDAWWGDARVEAIHYWLAVALLALVALHLCGVIVTSLRHRENLVAAMVHGRKRPPTGDDVS